MNRHIVIFIFVLFWAMGGPALAQISPGPLSAYHSHLEGMSHCTSCHELGDKVTNTKCLDCHTELKARVTQNKGYHVSAEVKGKNCVSCHSDHHGLNFQIVRFTKENFNHALTGYRLSGAHTTKKCSDCHKPEYIVNPSVKKKKFTFLGLGTACTTCHTDYHQKTLSQNCSGCHNNDAFKPATVFQHNSAKFQLHGMHGSVQCVKCHPITTRNGEKFQQFTGLHFVTCSSCHTDPHLGKFGQDCKSCHSEESFLKVKGISNFDHSKTGFPLENMHRAVICSSCHKTNLTDPLKHERCLDCHKDYHEGQFTRESQVQDCKSCHTTTGFNTFTFTIEQHNAGKFQLEGSHLATPCVACHKKQSKWNFKNIGVKCVDCHQDIHNPHISEKYYPGYSCQSCHTPASWNEITFDHAATGWALSVPHLAHDCRSCHFKQDEQGNTIQQFSELNSNCTTCHEDRHFGQFDVNGATNCLRCHDPNYWKIITFDHNNTAFKLDGRHRDVPCEKCHKSMTVEQKTYVLYKLKDTRCESCH